MYSKLPNLVIAFHGCDIETYENVLYKHQHLTSSNNDYDWLGNGIYFWEQNLERAWQWANDKARNVKSGTKTPAVIGAVIDLGCCLNLTDGKSINILKKQYEIFEIEMFIAGKDMPINKNVKNNTDVLLRQLDCAVIENLHEERRGNGEFLFDSVRGIFFEGNAIYKGSEFREKTHIQLCIRNPNCIKGYFAPLSVNPSYCIP